jgi:DNA-directed RNA polymerase subunit beta'
MEGADVIVSLAERTLGRTTAEDIKHPNTGAIICPANTYIDEEVALAIDKAGVDRILVRSVLTCESRAGLRLLLRSRPGARHARQRW